MVGLRRGKREKKKEEGGLKQTDCQSSTALLDDYLKIALCSGLQIDFGGLPAYCGTGGIPEIIVEANEEELN